MKSKKSYKIIFFLFSVLIAVSACKKDKPSPIKCDELLGDWEKDEGCYNFKLPPMNFFVSEANMYKQPCFNPNNQNEFVFHFRDNTQRKSQLVKYNILTKQKTVLYESSEYSIWGQPKWSKKGWIAFTRTRAYVDHVFIVKDNGDSLRQFTQNTANYDPAWDAKGDYLYWTHSPVLAVPHFFLKKGLYSSVIDTVLKSDGENQGYSTYNEISLYNTLFSKTVVNGTFSLGKADLAMQALTLTEIIDIDNPKYVGVLGIASSNHPNEIYVSFSGNGLYRVNTSTKYMILMMPFCMSKWYSVISCSADGRFLVGERIDSHLAKDEDGNPTGERILKSTIWLVDTKTFKELKIDL